MNKSQESKEVSASFTDEGVQAWMEEHLLELRQSVSGQRILYQSLLIGFVIGLAAHVGGYLLLSSLPGGILGLLADLLHALGWSLWTGVVVTLFIQVIPEVKRRQMRRYLNAYEAFRRKGAQAAGDGTGKAKEKPPARRPEHASGQKRKRNRPRKGG